jgi:hypothetical protein
MFRKKASSKARLAKTENVSIPTIDSTLTFVSHRHQTVRQLRPDPRVQPVRDPFQCHIAFPPQPQRDLQLLWIPLARRITSDPGNPAPFARVFEDDTAFAGN